VQPFLDRADRGVVILCRTSNPGAGDLQDLVVDGRPLYRHVAEKVARDWNGHGNCALVVGATWPEQLREVRAIVGDMPLLVPGVGAQGGDAEAVVRNARTADGTGLLVSSSRAILYASTGDDYATAAGAAARDLRDLLNRHR
jgi:orotidine-5'-phosphate decarboxylase